MISAISVVEDSIYAGNFQSADSLISLLKNQANRDGDDELLCRIFLLQAVSSYYKGDPQSLKNSTDLAFSLLDPKASDKTSANLLAKAYQCRAAFYDRFYYNPDSLVFYQRKAIEKLENSGNYSDKAMALANYANSMRMIGSLDSAAIYYRRALQMADSAKLSADKYIPLSNGLASVLTDLHDFDNSAVWWNKSMELLPVMAPFDRFNTFTGYGNDLYYQRKYEESNQLFRSLDRYLDSIGSPRWEKMFTSVNIADSYLRLGNVKAAAPLLDSVTYFFTKEQPNPVCMAYIYTLLMRRRMLEGNFPAVEKIEIDHPVSDKMRAEEKLARYELLAEFYLRSGKVSDALESQLKYANLVDSLRSRRLRQQVSALSATYERDRRILNLEAENNRHKARIFRLIMYIAFAVVAILVGIIIVAKYRASQKRREEKMLAKIISLRSENLRNRITPHFIYNAINHEMGRDDDHLSEGMHAVVRLIRYQQMAVSQMLVSLKEELAFVDDYVKVMADARNGKTEYKAVVADDIELEKVHIPSMSLQILVENAFKHGFTSIGCAETAKIFIFVTRESDGRIKVSVFNNGDFSHPEYSENSGNGLRIIAETIRIINEQKGSDISFSVNPNAEINDIDGFMATINIPDDL